MFKFISIDGSVEYRVLGRDNTVAEFIKYVLCFFKDDEGGIRINNLGLELEYKCGIIIKDELTPDILSSKIKEVTVRGGWYYITIIKEQFSFRKNTNSIARDLKEAIFEKIGSSLFEKRICATKMVGTLEPEYVKNYVETGFLIVKRYLELRGFKKVEYVRKIENLHILFAIVFNYETQREVDIPPIELYPGTIRDLFPRDN